MRLKDVKSLNWLFWGIIYYCRIGEFEGLHKTELYKRKGVRIKQKRKVSVL